MQSSASEPQRATASTRPRRGSSGERAKSRIAELNCERTLRALCALRASSTTRRRGVRLSGSTAARRCPPLVRRCAGRLESCLAVLQHGPILSAGQVRHGDHRGAGAAARHVSAHVPGTAVHTPAARREAVWQAAGAAPPQVHAHQGGPGARTARCSAAGPCVHPSVLTTWRLRPRQVRTQHCLKAGYTAVLACRDHRGHGLTSCSAAHGITVSTVPDRGPPTAPSSIRMSLRADGDAATRVLDSLFTGHHPAAGAQPLSKVGRLR